jgi:hypothetical protein
VQAAWVYAQMVRWGQAPLSPELLAAAKDVLRPDLYDAASSASEDPSAGEPADGIGTFAGPSFDPRDIGGHIASWPIARTRRARLPFFIALHRKPAVCGSGRQSGARQAYCLRTLIH